VSRQGRIGTRTAHTLRVGVALATVVLGCASTAPATAAPNRPARQTPPKPDPAFTHDLDTVMAVSPPASCLTVSIDGAVLYQRNSSAPQTPASTEKLFTSTAALDLLGRDHRFTTSVVATGPTAGATLTGDLTLVGGGDPNLTSSIYRAVRHIGPDRTTTLLDDLAAKVAATGIRQVTGRVVGDETRFDAQRAVPTWPSRYLNQNQAGPLSALDVDDGYTLEVQPGGIVRRRAEDPAASAAQIFTDLLGSKGVKVDGPAASGAAPAGARPVAQVQSAPLDAVVGDMLLHSDNQTAELLTKELGRVKGPGGSTAAGIEVLRAWRAQHSLAPAGSATFDGSGLDPGNRVTCDELVSVLGYGAGRKGPVAANLPVAATSGTLAHRFRNSPAAGRLRGKTGSLNSVTALAGFVDLIDGGTATFAYIANGEPVSAKVLAAQDLLATILARYRPPCTPARVHAVVAPVPLIAPGLALVTAGPALGAGPGLVVASDAFEHRFRTLGDRCLAGDRAARVRLGS
jgi:D-alanyl-D-alanine carboxypeptidase/D-alanyl-D-alanine-endopeptidase (penicillin-binding protein 4)